MKERHLEIDLLRGVAIIAMILIHTTYYFLSDKTALTLWNYSQFAVPVFIFCSAFVFFHRSYTFTFYSFVLFVKKRLVRLLIPYYIFIAVFIPLVYYFEPKKINGQYILENIVSIGGIDINWLVLLFIQFAIVMPIIFILYRKSLLLFFLYSIVAFISSVYFLFQNPPFDYKLIMWLPWSVIFLYTLFVVKNEGKKWFYPTTLSISFLLFLITRYISLLLNHSLYFQQNKYPPNIYFLFFGIFSTTILLFLAKKIKNKMIISFVSFFSFYSYQLYFIHYIILYVITLTFLKTYHFEWWSLFLIVLITTIVVQKIITNLKFLIFNQFLPAGRQV